MTASVLLSLSLLCYCKYADFFIENFNVITGMSVPLLKIALPIGISFYTFQIISYIVDVYRKDVKAQRNYINLALYVSMFPQLIAGPIVRYSSIEEQLKNRTHSIEKAATGIRRFIIGLSKKILIANILSEFILNFKGTEQKSVLYFWMYAAFFMLHIYFDFSGYSDMAIGLGRIFGFTLTENFDYPYISGSITEFWRRWHISLGTWFRDYLYIPLGGNRVGKLRWFINILVVWMATGFWHGAAWNFVLWGALFALLLIIEKLWLLKPLKRTRVVNHIYVLLLVMISFVLFDAANVPEAFTTVAAMFGGKNIPLVSTESIYYLKSYIVIFVVAIIGATPIPKRLIAAAEKNRLLCPALNIAEPIVLTLLLAVCTAFLIDGSFNPFLYFRF